MTQKPFTPNANEKLKNMDEAAKAIKAAIRALEQAKANAEDWSEWETLRHFEKQLSEFMSCDHGEAGYEVYLKNIHW